MVNYISNLSTVVFFFKQVGHHSRKYCSLLEITQMIGKSSENLIRPSSRPHETSPSCEQCLDGSLDLVFFAEQFCSNSSPSASAAFMLIGAVFKVNVVPLNPLKRDHPTLWSLFFLIYFLFWVFSLRLTSERSKRHINFSKFTK